MGYICFFASFGPSLKKNLKKVPPPQKKYNDGQKKKAKAEEKYGQKLGI